MTLGGIVAQQSICIVGGGVSGVGLAWCFAKAKQLKILNDVPAITLIHDQSQLGGHSYSYPVTVNGVTYYIDLGVQMIAPEGYPAVMSMLAQPEFQDVALQNVPLNISSAFPPVGGQTPYWGNFAGYQNTALWQQGKADCATFQWLIENRPDTNATLGQFLQENAAKFQNLENFENYFLDPYMSIMNGYGSALLDQVTVLEIAPLFDLGLAKFTTPGTGFKRFAKGSGQWINTMYEFAQSVLGSNLTVILGETVGPVWPASPQPMVQLPSWSKPRGFDAVVLTIDMLHCSQSLHNTNNKLWGPLYAQYVGTNDANNQQNSVWPLIPGYCYLHQDRSIFAPNMPWPLQETLQFTAYWATQQAPYDITYSFTTYVEKTLMGIADPAFEYYLTMYGFDPTKVSGVPIPAANKTTTSMNWTHGMWLPFFMEQQKQAFHMAQSASAYRTPYPNQPKTGIFFAGNNLTMDSEEGALASALVLADYAFDIPYAALLSPPSLDPKAWKVFALATAEIYALYHRLMFPSASGRGAAPALRRLA